MSIVRLSKVAATFACGLFALCLALQLWQAYVLAPWTRDGRISAQVIRIAPEVSGSVEAVFVADNQRVARGDPLYRIDPRSYRLAVRQREAELEQARETLRQRDEQWRRRMQLAGAVSREEVIMPVAPCVSPAPAPRPPGRRSTRRGWTCGAASCARRWTAM